MYSCSNRRKMREVKSPGHILVPRASILLVSGGDRELWLVPTQGLVLIGFETQRKQTGNKRWGEHGWSRLMTVGPGSDSINTCVENSIWRTSNGTIILNKHPPFVIEKVTVEGVTEVEIREILRVKKNCWLGWVVIVFCAVFSHLRFSHRLRRRL